MQSALSRKRCSLVRISNFTNTLLVLLPLVWLVVGCGGSVERKPCPTSTMKLFSLDALDHVLNRCIFFVFKTLVVMLLGDSIPAGRPSNWEENRKQSFSGESACFVCSLYLPLLSFFAFLHAYKPISCLCSSVSSSFEFPNSRMHNAFGKDLSITVLCGE